MQMQQPPPQHVFTKYIITESFGIGKSIDTKVIFRTGQTFIRPFLWSLIVRHRSRHFLRGLTVMATPPNTRVIQYQVSLLSPLQGCRSLVSLLLQ